MFLASRSVKAVLGAATIGSLALTDYSFAAAQTFLGNAVNNALGGQLQVQISVDGGKITSITTPVIPTGRNARYANFAVPTLTQEALVAQSATIQAVSGASYISTAWKQSLASAISKAGSALTSASQPTATLPATPPAPVVTKPAISGGENESEGVGHNPEGSKEGKEAQEAQEGSDDGYRAPSPKRTRSALPKPAPVLTPTASASPTSSALGLTMGAGVIKKTITCVKGKLAKTVKSTNPKCPAGYTLKKK